jgi:hypothetical protein
MSTLMDNSSLHEGFSVLEAILKTHCRVLSVSYSVVGSTCHILLEASGPVPPKAFLSRLVSLTLGLESYTIHTRVLTPTGESTRIVNLVQSLGSAPSMSLHMLQHFYVVSGLDKDRKSPLGMFISRGEAESVVASGKLQARLGNSLMSTFENLVVEKWRVGEVAQDPLTKRLTLFATDGTLLLSLPEDLEGAQRTMGRLTSILSSSFSNE